MPQEELLIKTQLEVTEEDKDDHCYVFIGLYERDRELRGDLRKQGFKKMGEVGDMYFFKKCLFNF